MGVTVRPLQPADVPVATDLFALGMTETLTTGLRAELLTPSLPRALGAVALALLPPQLMRWAGLTAEAAAGLALVVGTVLLLVYLLLPKIIARDYIAKSLATDMQVLTRPCRAAPRLSAIPCAATPAATNPTTLP